MTSYATANEATMAGVAGDATAAVAGASHQEKRTLPMRATADDCDYCDSLSDGREKTDTTPENLKKIDDVIECETMRSRSIWSHPVVDTNSRSDESSTKLDMEKLLRTHTNETLSKRDRIESETNAAVAAAVTVVAPLTAAPLPDESSLDSASTTTITPKQSFAFTIDNFNDKECDPAAAAAKYKNMLERFQSRHRRGASMSKLENSGNTKEPTLSTSSSAMPLTVRESSRTMTKSLNVDNCELMVDLKENETMDATPTASKVKLRVRDRSTSRVRDSSKRHSWSPRSSTNEATLHNATNKTSNAQPTPQTQARPNAEAMLPQSGRKVIKSKPPAPLQLPKSNANMAASGRQQPFTPRSIAMQMALQKVDFLCPQPPLAEFKHLNNEGDNLSEAGTYTLDGDNYTEEQKDLMNIDKSTLERLRKAAKARMLNSRPTALEIPAPETRFNTKIPINTTTANRNNVLEVNYYHEAEPVPPPMRANTSDFLLSSHQSASSYLEKIKSRVLRNMSATKNVGAGQESLEKMTESSSSEQRPASGDVGTFTSVTTSGVLAKQSALDPRPKLTRRSSLSTSQIDSSEYISNEAKLKSSGAAVYAGGGFTDHQKAEYRLNVFTNQKDNQNCAANRSFIQTPPDSPSAYKTTLVSDTAVLKTAQNKNDWIQEWARNARARSLACEGNTKNRQLQAQELMTRSYNCSEAGESQTDDSLINAQRNAPYNKTLAERYRLAGGDFDYSSDPAISSSFTAKSSNPEQRPPKSPSKIPSPLHSIGRTRSASRTRASLQNVMQQDAVEADAYLQKTAAAINNLQQSLSRRNSLKSPHNGSPRAASNKGRGAYYSPEECSPQHSLDSPTGYAPAMLRNVHRRNLSMESYSRGDPHAQLLMTSSFNEQQLKLLTANAADYMQKPRGRKNSFDGQLQASPARRVDNWNGANRTRIADHQEQQQENSLSPLRRSSSFSAKVATARAARPQFQNLYTPPAARGINYMPAGSQTNNAIKKSASSNNFRNVYSDYDENLAYYIKDEDDYGDGEDYYSSGDDLEINEDYMYGEHQAHLREEASHAIQSNENSAPNVPLSNTRYNKALLMRIERSKQKVAGTVGGGGPSSAGAVKTPLGGGFGACPNTPELPRRTIKSAPRTNGARQSMPRDSSLNRLAGQIPNSLASAKKQILQTAAAVPTNSNKTAAGARVQPKYLDISKYKPAQGNNFLRKNDAKSTLKPGGGAESMKRSPSSSSMGLSRGDATRASNRSSKSVTSSVMTTSGTSLSGRAASAVRRDAAVAKQKEAEMAMWKRRSKYDPMKAAAEDRRKKEEAKKMLQTQNEIMSERPSRSPYRRGHL